ncbi:MAG TPA: DUF11 domain-containing protein [Planctomycetes bacterium]|nr:DUF11 domain-containing protein [Fuerstiella sp.]HIK93205.1 DUF11 domain-containing protein [Planctomycetota bacterium]
MHIRRITLFVSGLLLLPAAFAVEDANPFARWDQLRKSTSATATPKAGSEAVTSKAQTAVEYFAPSATAQNGPQSPKPQQVGTPENAGPSGNQERLKTSAKSRQRAKTPTEKKLPRPSTHEWSSTFAVQPKAKSLNGASSSFTETNNAAAFISNPQGQSQIQQVSAEISEVTPQDTPDNPFSDFLSLEDGASGVTSYNQSAPAPNATAFPGSGTSQTASVEISGTELPTAPRGPQTPSVTLQWIHHSDFNVGQECRCDLVVENTGRSIIRSVVAEALLPAGLEVVNSKPVPETDGGTARWTFGELQSGEKRLIELVLIPRQQGDVQLNAFVRLTGASSSTFSVKEPKVVVRIDGPAAVAVGQQANYTVHVANPGSGTARNVVIQAAIPDGMEHREGKLLTIEIGTLNPGEFRQARLSLTGNEGGEHSLAVRVRAEGGLSDQTIETVSVAEPRLNIGLRGPSKRMTGQTCEYEIVVVNEGRMQSNNVRAKYRIPEGCEFISANRGGKFREVDGTIDWFVGSLEPNQVSHFRVTLRASAPGTSTHQVGVVSEHGKMTMAEHATEIQGNAQLSLKVVASNRQLYPGDETVFEVRIENTGASPAMNVGLSCELAPGLERLDVSGPSEYIADNGVMVFRSMPTLDPGKTAVFAVKTRCIRAGSHSMRVRVASESVSEPLIGEETATGLQP